MPIESVRPSNHFILCHPLLLLPSTFPIIRVFSNESALPIRWPKDWSFSFSIGPSMDIQGQFLLQMTGLISLQSKELSRVFSNTTVQKHQFHAQTFFIVQFSYQYVTTGKTIAFTIWIVLAKWYLCFLIYCLGLSQLFFQGASVF